MKEVREQDAAELAETAGKVGAEFAGKLATQLTDAIDGFPTFGATADAQTAAIARLVAEEVGDYAGRKEAGSC